MPIDPTIPYKSFSETEFMDTPLARAFSPEPVQPKNPSNYPDFNSGELLITRHRGSFLRPCPATPRYNCCGLNIFHFGQGCSLGCSYCILGAYLGSEALVLFGNYKEGLAELQKELELLTQNPQNYGADPQSPRSFRFCTGEFTDSLLLDPRSQIAPSLIELFRHQAPAILELKTKTAHINHLMDLDHGGRTVISFSINAPLISAVEEKGAASLDDRFKAAALAQKNGYPIGLHFDPIIYHEGWADGYGQTIENIARQLDPQKVAFISLGCFRYLPSLKKTMLGRHKTQIFDAEFVLAKDGKMRYPRPIRLTMYRYLLDRLQSIFTHGTIIYLCMESGRMWQDLFGKDPKTFGLTSLFR